MQNKWDDGPDREKPRTTEWNEYIEDQYLI